MPTFPPAHKRVQFLGTLTQATGGGAEIFDFGFADDSALTTQALAEALAPVYESFFGDADTGLSEYAVCTGVRVEAVAADGKVSNSYFVSVAAQQGTATGNTCTILSSVATLETNTPNGHGRMVRGRMYPPGLAGPVVGGTVTLDSADSYAAKYRDFIQSCNGAGAVASVASVTGGGQIAHVTAVSAGTPVDTQRRRKNHVTAQRSPKYGV